MVGQPTGGGLNQSPPRAGRRRVPRRGDHLARYRKPIAQRGPGRTGHVGPSGRGDHVVRLRTRCGHAPGRSRGVADRALGRVAHPPAQRPHHRPQRHCDDALGHGAGPDTAQGHRPPGHPGSGRRCDGHAGLGPGVPPGSPRRPDPAAADRRDRGRTGSGIRAGGRRPLGPPDRPPSGHPHRRLPDRPRRQGGGHRRRHRPLHRARRDVPRRRPLRPNGDPVRTGAGHTQRAPAGHPRLPLLGRAGGADGRRAPASRHWC